MPFQQNKKKFKSLDETYKGFTFIYAMSLMYPNPKIDKMRGFAICILYLLCVPIYLTFINDMSIRFQNNDIQNMARQLVFFVALLFANMKCLLTMIYRKEFRDIFDSINKDYEEYNDLPEDFQEVAEDTVKRTKFVETGWISLVGVAGAVFPLSAILLNIYSLFFSDTPRRYMIHECHVWLFTQEQQYSTPVYEIFFLYCFFVAILIFVGFTGFDGMFIICMYHLKLKIKIFSKKLEHMLVKSDYAKTKENIAQVVKEQHNVFNLKNKLMKCYGIWLVLIFVVSIVQTAMSLSQIASNRQKSGADLNFIMFAVGCTAHIFFPCYISSEVTHAAAKISDVLYNTPWEDIPDSGIRRSLIIMIARAQNPMILKAMGLVTFNMEMFVSVMQTAYSMFTLLR